MELYADLFLLVNFFCDLLVLWVCARLLYRRVKKRRLFFSAAIGALYALTWMLLYPAPLLLFFLSFLCSLLMVLAAFGFHGWSVFFKALGSFYLTCLLLGGAAGGVHAAIGRVLPPLYALLTLTLCLGSGTLFCLFFGRLLIKERRKESAMLTFVADGKCYRVKGLVDSGNLLLDPLSLFPAVLLDPSLFDLPPPCDRTLLIKTAAGEELFPSFLPEKATVDGIERCICIVLCPPPHGSFGGFPALLPLF